MARTRSNTQALVRLFSASSMPIYALDEECRIVYCNTACTRWTGVELEQLVKLKCSYQGGQQATGLAAVAAGLSPPPEVFQGESGSGSEGERMSGLVACPGPSGRLVRRRAEFLPLRRDPAGCAGVLVIVEDRDLAESEVPAADGPEAGSAELHQQLLEFHHRLQARYHVDQLVGESPAMRRVRAQLALASQGQTRVLVVGPPGSGREHVARTIHYGGQARTFGQLTPLSCPLLDAELLQTMLVEFLKQGDELGPQQSNSLMLLDVDQLPGDAQGELAGFLNLPDVQLHTIATARQGLLERARQGQFRHDLACGLSTLVIELPGLAERPEDIPLLAQHFLELGNAEGGPQCSGFTPEALDQLAAHPWLGNLDQLAQVVRQARRQARGPRITAADLPRQLDWAAAMVAHPRHSEENIVLDELLEQIEKELVERALKRCKGNKAQAARLLGTTRARLHRRLAQWGL